MMAWRYIDRVGKIELNFRFATLQGKEVNVKRRHLHQICWYNKMGAKIYLLLDRGDIGGGDSMRSVMVSKISIS